MPTLEKHQELAQKIDAALTGYDLDSVGRALVTITALYLTALSAPGPATDKQRLSILSRYAALISNAMKAMEESMSKEKGTMQ